MGGFLSRFARNRAAIAGAAAVAVVVAMAALAPVLYPAGAFVLAGPPLQPPFGHFILGTDSLGRDILAGIMHGARTSLLIGVLATLGSIAIGLILGALAGFYRGIVDTSLMRLTEFFQTVPSFILAIVLVAVLSPSLGSEILAIAAVSWPSIARLVRGEFASTSSRDFILATVGLGAGDVRIIFLHVFPNCASPLIAVSSLLVANAILFEAGLSFLGLGDPNLMSWGLMISMGREVLRSAWWICTFPGIAILVSVLAINLVGDGLNEALNPRLRER